MEFRRYAVYVTLPPGELADVTAAWLGWDVEAGRTVPHPEIPGLDVAAITETPRKYGFHGTVKPPMRLADGTAPEALAADLEALCQSLAPVTLDGLHVSRLGSFLALVPVGDAASLSALAAAVVKGLDAHRAAPSEAELTRRRANGLSPAQEANLIRWGYPYVMAEFRYHMTLSGRLSEDMTTRAIAELEPLLGPVLPRPFTITDLSLVGEGDDGFFRLIHRYTLSG